MALFHQLHLLLLAVASFFSMKGLINPCFGGAVPFAAEVAQTRVRNDVVFARP